ncbi:MAG: hypothetical protein J6Y53_01305 [Alphaproteobacteria bacterium]|nr:hypothetical protein [Alphaproteobacteria bacterium]
MFVKLLAFIIFCLCSGNALADETSFFSSLYTTVKTKHLTSINIEDLALSGFKKISEINPSLKFSNGSDMVYIYAQNKQIAMLRKPTDSQDIKSWAEIASTISEKLGKITHKNPSLIAEKIAFDSVQSLQDHSRYHFSYENNSTSQNETYYNLLEEDILYIKMTDFNHDNEQSIRTALNKYPQSKGIILDLRGNQGGQINEAISIAKIFIDDGIILSTKGKTFDSEKYYVSETKDAISLPLAVLIDQNTASSAEILAAALKEQSQAVLIGSTSFGKGNYQETYLFENGGKLALTVGEYYTPSGKSIDRKGLSPDYCIINDIPYKTENCPRQLRENQPFDIEFAIDKLK